MTHLKLSTVLWSLLFGLILLLGFVGPQLVVHTQTMDSDELLAQEFLMTVDPLTGNEGSLAKDGTASVIDALLSGKKAKDERGAKDVFVKNFGSISLYHYEHTNWATSFLKNNHSGERSDIKWTDGTKIKFYTTGDSALTEALQEGIEHSSELLDGSSISLDYAGSFPGRTACDRVLDQSLAALSTGEVVLCTPSAAAWDQVINSKTRLAQTKLVFSKSGEIRRSVIWLNPSKNLDEEALHYTVEHELQHALGLKHSSSKSECIMNAYYKKSNSDQVSHGCEGGAYDYLYN